MDVLVVVVLRIQLLYRLPTYYSCPDLRIVHTLLCPSPDKVDLERLLRDIPKYQPWIPSSAFEQWKMFSEEAHSILTTVNFDVLWVLPILQLSARNRPANSIDNTELSDTTPKLV